METYKSKITPLDNNCIDLVNKYGARITAIEPLGMQIQGLNLALKAPPPPELLQALERAMSHRGFLVFKNEQQIDPDDFLRVSCWWGGRELHSTHGVHPATPNANRHIFRLSNDQRHGIPGVGPQWHNDGSFIAETFSHSGYHIIRPAERGGGTYFAHQGAAFNELSTEKQGYWRRLFSVNSASGVLHPLVHEHPVSQQLCIWLHLGMTGAVIEELSSGGFRLLDKDELTRLCHDYNNILNSGLKHGYAMNFEYQEYDCVFIDNLAVAHRASPEAHLPVEQQGLRIMHRSTVKGIKALVPDNGLPSFCSLDKQSPFGEGVWKAGGIGFRWDDHIPMQN